MKSKKNSNLGIILLFIVGLLVLLYPTISNAWNEARNKKLMEGYEATIAEIDTETLDKERQRAVNYNKTLIGIQVPDAFAYEEANHPSEDYESYLNLAGDGYMCTVDIPVIDVRLPVYHYTTEEVLEKGAGHLPGSSLPVGGPSTHTVISAHRGLPSAKLFTDLDRVKEGDIFYLLTLNETLAYEVDFIKVIEPSDTDDLAIQENMDYATLFTCTPYAVNSHRLLVRGHRVPFSQEQYDSESGKTANINMNLLWVRILCVFIGLALAFGILWLMKLREDKKAKEAKAKKEHHFHLEDDEVKGDNKDGTNP